MNGLDIDFELMRQPGFYNNVILKRNNDVMIAEKYGWKNVSRCPICNVPNTKNTAYYKTEFGTYYICKTCFCLYRDTIAKKQNTGRFSTLKGEAINLDPDEKKREYRKERFGGERIQIIDKYTDKPLSKMSLLDIGCNTGFFIEKAKEYFNEVFGLEKEKSLAEYGEQKTGCKIYTDDVRSIKRKFDVVTLFDTLEHIEDPLSFLEDCSSILNEKGTLLIFTPNYQSLGFDFLGSRCNHIYPGHVVLYCKETCSYLSNKLGLSPVFYQTCGMDIFDILSFIRDIQRVDIETTVLYDKGWDLANLLQYKINKKEYANSLRFILKKE